VVALPIPTGVAIGIGLSLVHGVWITTHTRVSEFRNVPDTTIWWPVHADVHADARGVSLPGVRVLGFPAPLLFANAEIFKRGMMAAIDAPGTSAPSLVVLEGGGMADVDYTAAQAVREVIENCRAREIDFAIARLESVRARDALERFGVLALLGADHLFHSVAEAVAQGKAARPG
jgi:SulP family sulfate permease